VKLEPITDAASGAADGIAAEASVVAACRGCSTALVART
jgi:hypothetical protein